MTSPSPKVQGAPAGDDHDAWCWGSREGLAQALAAQIEQVGGHASGTSTMPVSYPGVWYPDRMVRLRPRFTLDWTTK